MTRQSKQSPLCSNQHFNMLTVFKSDKQVIDEKHKNDMAVMCGSVKDFDRFVLECKERAIIKNSTYLSCLGFHLSCTGLGLEELYEILMANLRQLIETYLLDAQKRF